MGEQPGQTREHDEHQRARDQPRHRSFGARVGVHCRASETAGDRVRIEEGSHDVRHAKSDKLLIWADRVLVLRGIRQPHGHRLHVPDESAHQGQREDCGHPVARWHRRNVRSGDSNWHFSCNLDALIFQLEAPRDDDSQREHDYRCWDFLQALKGRHSVEKHHYAEAHEERDDVRFIWHPDEQVNEDFKGVLGREQGITQHVLCLSKTDNNCSCRCETRDDGVREKCCEESQFEKAHRQVQYANQQRDRGAELYILHVDRAIFVLGMGNRRYSVSNEK
mmetsp:Transcript_33120/g.68349  ORF Transcript_33120/g.68349 Transcript_33120/m.68349 type:complete len:278 (+) Transcript_33120:1010-1843(+)